MRQVIIIILSVISFSAFSQQLNKLGKIEVNEIPQMPDHRIEKISGVYKIYKDSFIFEGNTYYEIPHGFISSLEVFNDKKDFIKHYNAKGKLIVTIMSDRIINLKVSPDGSKLVFYDTENIIHVDMNTYRIDTLPGSFVYSYLGENDLIYYDSESKNIWFKGNNIQIEQFPNQFVEFRNKVYVITEENIFELIGNSLYSRYEFEGKFFDSKIVDDEFYFVDKLEKRKNESFSLYKTSDFSRYILFDRKDELNR